MMKKIYPWILAFWLLIPCTLQASVLKVKNVNDGGPGSLRDEIAAASIGDTILIDVTGTLGLTADLQVDKKLVIIGPYACHFSIDTKDFRFRITDSSGDTTKVLGVRFFNTLAPSPNAAVDVSAGHEAMFIDCVFQNLNTTGSGAAVFVSGTFHGVNCSFINCFSSNSGGAVFISNTSVGNFVNCTFSGNTSSNDGGAISTGGPASINQCTFFNNTAGTNGEDINANLPTAQVFLRNNLFFHGSPTGPEFTNTGGGTWNNSGGNVYTFNPPAFVPPSGLDITGAASASMQLDLTTTTDGYGLMYHRILSSTSPAVDAGVAAAGVTPPVDCRRAPRILYGDNALNPDAGAVEFTPYTVTTAANFPLVWGNMGVFPGPQYMDFDCVGPISVTIAAGAPLTYTAVGGTRIIDGYSQHGTRVAGPSDGTVGNYITPANIGIELIANSSNIFNITSWTDQSWIAGLKMNCNNNNMAVFMNNCRTHFYGNHIFSASGNGYVGIYAAGASQIVKIGGVRVHECNQFAGFNSGIPVDPCGLMIKNTAGGFVKGNLIGLTLNGLAAQSNGIGIVLEGNDSTLTIGGDFNEWSKNVISGNLMSDIYMVSSGYSAIRIAGNIIGPDISGLAVPLLNNAGIHIQPNTNGIIGGKKYGSGNIIGGHTDGIRLNLANQFNVFGNYIGISPLSTTYPEIPNNTGIAVLGNGDMTHKIGNGTYWGRNYLCENDAQGIFVDNANGHLFANNFIGVRPNNTPGGNGGGLGGYGMNIINNSFGITIRENVISANTADGINYTSSGGSDLVFNNKIGTDTTGTAAMGNLNGVLIQNNGPGLTLDGNLISGNGSYGVLVADGTTLVTIKNGKIGTNVTGTAALPNGSGIGIDNSTVVRVDDNIISGNGADGILIGNNSNDILLRGNKIGTNAAAADLGNGIMGVNIIGGANNISIGGSTSSAYNAIAFNDFGGILLEKTCTHVGIFGNHIFKNDKMGIALNDPDIPLPNDANDIDSSPADYGNDGQNKPENMSARVCGATVSVTGTVNVFDASGDYRIQIYQVLPGNVDPTGHGEGDTLLAFTTINAGGSNTINFNLNITGLALGDVLSATCTYDESILWSTSEFSDTVMVKSGFVASIIDSSDVTCNGAANGFAEVGTSGTAGALSYQWYTFPAFTTIAGATAATINTLGPGSYVAVVYDATLGCYDTSNVVTIAEPAALSVSETHSDVTCNGACNGTITLTESGGVPPYMYSIDGGLSWIAVPSFTGLCPGNYNHLVQDANGCTTPAGLSITISEPPVLTATPSVVNESCDGLNDGSINFSTVGGVPPYQYSIDAGGTFFPGSGFSPLADGTYNWVIQDLNLCTVSGIVTVGAGSLPPTANAGIDFEECQSTVVFTTLNGSATNFTSVTWTATEIVSWGGPGPNALNPDAYYSGAAVSAGSMYFILTASQPGCPDAVDSVFVLFTPPHSAFAGADATICSDMSYVLNGTITGSPSSSWSSTGTGTFSPDNITLTGVTYTPSSADISAGTVDIILTTDSSGACAVASDPLTLTILPAPIAVAGADATICTGDTYSLDGTSSTGTITTYSWDEEGGPNISNIATASVSPSVTTNYILTVGNGTCSDADTITVTVSSPPDASFAYFTNSLCTDGGIEFVTSVATPGGTFSGFGGVVVDPATGEIDPSASTVGSGGGVIYTLTTPCLADDTVFITISNPPSGTLTGGGTFCPGDTTAGFTVTNSGTGAWTVDIYESSVYQFTSTPPTSTYNLTGMPAGTYTAIIFDSVTGCSALASGSAVINFAAPNDPSFSYADTALCLSDGPQTPTVVTSGGTFSALPGGLTLAADGTVTASSSTPGTYNVVYSFGGSCASSDTVQFIINGPPTAVITPEHEACYLDTIQFVGTPSGGAWGGVFGINPTTGQYVSILSGAGVFTIQYLYTDPTTGCSVIDTNQITVHALPPAFFTGLSSPYCVSDGIDTITGVPSGGSFFVNGVFQSFSTLLYNPSAPGVDTIIYVTNDPVTGCYNFEGQGALVQPDPVTPILSSSPPYDFCATSPQPITVTNPGAGGVVWYYDAALTSQFTAGPTIISTDLPAGSGTVYIVNTSGTSCVSSPLALSYTSIDGSLVNTGGPYDICSGTSTVLNLVLPGATTWVWNSDPTLNDTSLLNPTVNPTVTTTYYVTVNFTAIPGGCAITDSAVVNVTGCSLENVTNAFTPDGDGINDVWVINGVLSHPENKVIIFNRWGDKLIEIDNYDNLDKAWDGRFNGSLVAVGTYYYIIQFKDDGQQKAAWIQVNY